MHVFAQSALANPEVYHGNFILLSKTCMHVIGPSMYCLPAAAIIDEKIFCVHGGLSPELTNLRQIQNIVRPTDVPDTGLLCDIIWADPDKEIDGWGENDRGVSFTFGEDIVAQFLHKHDMDLICRAHQVVEDGYEFFADRQLVTLFSAPLNDLLQILDLHFQLL